MYRRSGRSEVNVIPGDRDDLFELTHNHSAYGPSKQQVDPSKNAGFSYAVDSVENGAFSLKIKGNVFESTIIPQTDLIQLHNTASTHFRCLPLYHII